LKLTRRRWRTKHEQKRYVEKLKAQLDECNAEVREWEAKAKGTQADVRIEYKKQLEAFRRQRDQAVEQMRQIQAAAGDAWLDLVPGADEACGGA
jgi:multidrug resistance efflux pump